MINTHTYHSLSPLSPPPAIHCCSGVTLVWRLVCTYVRVCVCVCVCVWLIWKVSKPLTQLGVFPLYTLWHKFTRVKDAATPNWSSKAGQTPYRLTWILIQYWSPKTNFRIKTKFPSEDWEVKLSESNMAAVKTSVRICSEQKKNLNWSVDRDIKLNLAAEHFIFQPPADKYLLLSVQSRIADFLSSCQHCWGRCRPVWINFMRTVNGVACWRSSYSVLD